MPSLRFLAAGAVLSIVAAIAFSGFLSAATSAAPDAANARCARPAHYKTVLQTKSVRVVKRRTHTRWQSGWLHYGCLRSRGKFVRLGLDYRDPQDDAHGFVMRSFKPAGPSVGFIWTAFGEFDDVVGITSVNLRTGAKRTFEPYGTLAEELGYVEYAGVERYVLRPTGSFAWLTDTARAGNGRWGPGVFAFDTGGLRRLDERTGQVDRTSLRLTRSTVTWREAGLLKSAPLD